MANEEQMKAFAAYMSGGGGGGSSTASAGQPIPQYPGSVANPASQCLFNVSSIRSARNIRSIDHLLTTVAAIPWPWSASSSTNPSARSSEFHRFIPRTAGYIRATSCFWADQRPPPLGQGQAPGQSQLSNAQSMSTGPVSSGYTQLPRDYTSQQPPPPRGYNVGWQYTDPNVGSVSSAMAPTQRNMPFVAPSKDNRVDERFSYHYRAASEAQPQVEEQTVPKAKPTSSKFTHCRAQPLASTGTFENFEVQLSSIV
ncbi:hypothetical protein E8E11_005873 [Didymella keratinophila]|nr:hypothetical protein E8E11_005873 [Didymella keratinophila]